MWLLILAGIKIKGAHGIWAWNIWRNGMIKLWRHNMKRIFVLFTLCRFSADSQHRSLIKQNLDGFFAVKLNKRLHKQPSGPGYEMYSRSWDITLMFFMFSGEPVSLPLTHARFVPYSQDLIEHRNIAHVNTPPSNQNRPSTRKSTKELQLLGRYNTET